MKIDFSKISFSEFRRGLYEEEGNDLEKIGRVVITRLKANGQYYSGGAKCQKELSTAQSAEKQ